MLGGSTASRTDWRWYPRLTIQTIILPMNDCFAPEAVVGQLISFYAFAYQLVD
jgi:hypothetical protein